LGIIGEILISLIVLVLIASVVLYAVAEPLFHKMWNRLTAWKKADDRLIASLRARTEVEREALQSARREMERESLDVQQWLGRKEND
jgi:hypothetical protein